jgi:hypothetical protein
MTMVQDLLANDPDNIWNKRASAWVHYDYMKQHANPDGRSKFLEHLTSMKELDLPESEEMVLNQLAYQISRFLHSIPLDANHKQSLINLNDVWGIVHHFRFKRPTKEYSIILSSFQRFNKGWSGYPVFVREWGLDNFMLDDYKASYYGDRRIMPLAEQVYSAYAKWVVKPGQREVELHGFFVYVDSNPHQNLEEHPDLIPRMLNLVKEHPEYDFPRYFLAQLLMLRDEDRSQAWEVLKPFAIKKSTEFWVWELIGHIHSDQPDLKLACLCKAMTSGGKPEFLVGVQLELVNALVQHSLFKEAKIELQKNISVRERFGWSVPKAATDLTAQDWFNATEAKGDNDAFLREKAGLAETLLLEGFEETMVVLVHVNTEKDTVSFVAEGDIAGFFRTKKLIRNPKAGQCYKVKMKADGDNGFHKLLSANPTDEMPDGLVKNVKSAVSMNRTGDFAKVEDVFVDGQLIKKYGLVDGETITVRAVRSFDRKWSKWGWRALSITKP